MRKRSKYRPKSIALNPVKYVMDGLRKLAHLDSPMQAIRVSNHLALARLTKGEATKEDINVLITAVNFTEALNRMKIGAEFDAEIKAGLDALFAVGQRAAKTGKFIMTGPEMKALNVVLDVHDAQLDFVTLAEMEKATELVRKEIAAKRVRVMMKVEQ